MCVCGCNQNFVRAAKNRVCECACVRDKKSSQLTVWFLAFCDNDVYLLGGFAWNFRQHKAYACAFLCTGRNSVLHALSPPTAYSWIHLEYASDHNTLHLCHGPSYTEKKCDRMTLLRLLIGLHVQIAVPQLQFCIHRHGGDWFPKSVM